MPSRPRWVRSETGISAVWSLDSPACGARQNPPVVTAMLAWRLTAANSGPAKLMMSAGRVVPLPVASKLMIGDVARCSGVGSFSSCGIAILTVKFIDAPAFRSNAR